MAIEIERKFLVLGDDWRTDQGIRFRQGYLNRDRERTVRVRITDTKAFIAVKGVTRGAVRAEYEYEIPVLHAEELLKLCDGPIIEKVRYIVACNGFVWEVDEFLGENEGLVVAEIELEKDDQCFERPGWLGVEVTDDARYFNSNLCRNPYHIWRLK